MAAQVSSQQHPPIATPPLANRFDDTFRPRDVKVAGFPGSNSNFG
jgi:hypothetical protein